MGYVQMTLTPNDNRHGTYAGYNAGCRNECCKTAAWRYQKGRVLDAARGRPRLIDATGTRRRIQALIALGWSQAQIGEACGVTPMAVRHWRQAEQVWRSTAEKLAAAYERMCMKLPPETNGSQRNVASRMRSKAKSEGWVPPLAWDDIDNDPAPKTAPRERRDILADFDELVGLGESEHEAARRLGVNPASIKRARQRAGKVA